MTSAKDIESAQVTRENWRRLTLNLISKDGEVGRGVSSRVVLLMNVPEPRNYEQRKIRIGSGIEQRENLTFVRRAMIRVEAEIIDDEEQNSTDGGCPSEVCRRRNVLRRAPPEEEDSSKSNERRQGKSKCSLIDVGVGTTVPPTILLVESTQFDALSIHSCERGEEGNHESHAVDQRCKRRTPVAKFCAGEVSSP